MKKEKKKWTSREIKEHFTVSDEVDGKYKLKR